jgi:hypothetical protein
VLTFSREQSPSFLTRTKVVFFPPPPLPSQSGALLSSCALTLPSLLPYICTHRGGVLLWMIQLAQAAHSISTADSSQSNVADDLSLFLLDSWSTQTLPTNTSNDPGNSPTFPTQRSESYWESSTFKTALDSALNRRLGCDDGEGGSGKKVEKATAEDGAGKIAQRNLCARLVGVRVIRV